jgi:hypothetical protein
VITGQRQNEPALTLQRCTVADEEHVMNNIIWLVGLVVIILFILGFFGLR